ncbi:hypothetical protein T265_08711 [Opisthorchis viverrini]|uniref:Uncharacterized protein n=1 Tax=Opisthorchis viverrini TaxID=6198 RepID=A0A074ZCP1_OPIVI|nr:hypothetical protein T265_08711 [Opisthorchis viverrini]KER23387.1 hypothetical protein T265_08711 [Opisthorchis viverrini]
MGAKRIYEKTTYYSHASSVIPTATPGRFRHLIFNLREKLNHLIIPFRIQSECLTVFCNAGCLLSFHKILISNSRAVPQDATGALDESVRNVVLDISDILADSNHSLFKSKQVLQSDSTNLAIDLRFQETQSELTRRKYTTCMPPHQ